MSENVNIESAEPTAMTISLLYQLVRVFSDDGSLLLLRFDPFEFSFTSILNTLIRYFKHARHEHKHIHAQHLSLLSKWPTRAATAAKAIRRRDPTTLVTRPRPHALPHLDRRAKDALPQPGKPTQPNGAGTAVTAVSPTYRISTIRVAQPVIISELHAATFGVWSKTQADTKKHRPADTPLARH